MVARLVLETSDVMSSRFESEDAHQINASPSTRTKYVRVAQSLDCFLNIRGFLTDRGNRYKGSSEGLSPSSDTKISTRFESELGMGMASYC